MDKRFVPTVFLLALIAIIYIVSQGVQSRGNFAYVTIAASDTMTVELLRNDVRSRQACERAAATFSALMTANCPTCKINAAQCLETPPAERRALFDEAPVPYPSARMPGGVIAFLSANAEEALLACKMSAAIRPGADMKALVSCFPAETPRPLSAKASQRLREARLAFAGIGAAEMLAALGLAIYLLLRVRKRRDGGDAAARIAGNPDVSLPKFDPWPAKIVLAATDLIGLVAIFLAVSCPVAIRPSGGITPEANVLILHLGMVFVTITWFWALGEHYSVRRPLWDELREISRVVGTMFLISGAVTFAVGLESSRVEYLAIWLMNLLIIPIGRSAARGLLDIAGCWSMPTVVIGTGANAEEAVRVLSGEGNMGYVLIAQLWTRSGVENDAEAASTLSLPSVETSMEELLNTLQRLGSPQVVLALDSLSDPESQMLVQKLSSSVPNVHIVPSIRGLPLFGTRLSHFFSHDILFLTVRNNLSRRSYRWVKRGFDLVAAVAITAILLPVLLALAYLVRRDGGSATYGHMRVGQSGRKFHCLKFRSMQMGADKILQDLLRNDPIAMAEWEKDFKLKNDPRVTRIGHFLRKSSLDELPQLINVIRGEMSLVGPRPVVEEELARYGDQAVLYLQVNPGMTGLWQISGRNDTTYAERVGLDTWYVRNWSLWYDIAILLNTVRVVFRRSGAY